MTYFLSLFVVLIKLKSFKMKSKGLIPRVFFLREMRKFSREIIVRMRDEDK